MAPNVLELGGQERRDSSDDATLAVGVLEEREAKLMRAGLALHFCCVTSMTACLLCSSNVVFLAQSDILEVPHGSLHVLRADRRHRRFPVPCA
eukprot:4263088-Pyramimonas_sp.AAC.1